MLESVHPKIVTRVVKFVGRRPGWLGATSGPLLFVDKGELDACERAQAGPVSDKMLVERLADASRFVDLRSGEDCNDLVEVMRLVQVGVDQIEICALRQSG